MTHGNAADGSSPKARFSNGLREVLHWLEILIAIGAIVFVVIGAVQVAGMSAHLLSVDGLKGFSVGFEEILSALLLLVVGVELAIMLVLRRPESLVEIMFFVIARKVLIKTEHVYDLLMAVAAIGGLFAIERYLISRRRELKKASADSATGATE